MFGKSTTSTSAPAAEAQQKIGTIIGPGAVLNGDLTAPEAIRIDGKINGNCICDKNLILGPDGQIEGNIKAQNVIISGKVHGDIAVQGKMEILSTGKVCGDITARSLVVDEDAYFDGRCTMTTGTVEPPRVAAKNPLEPVTIPDADKPNDK